MRLQVIANVMSQMSVTGRKFFRVKQIWYKSQYRGHYGGLLQGAAARGTIRVTIPVSATVAIWVTITSMTL